MPYREWSPAIPDCLSVSQYHQELRVELTHGDAHDPSCDAVDIGDQNHKHQDAKSTIEFQQATEKLEAADPFDGSLGLAS